MPLDKLFEKIDQARNDADWRAAFGEPQVVGNQTIIPVATVSYGFGLGFGGATEPEAEECCSGEGGGGGGGASARPLGALVVTPDEVYFQETIDAARLSMAETLVGALFIWQFAKTLRALLGRS